MASKDYYDTIGVKRDATPEQIRRAYRKLARKYHPDVSKEKDAEQRFKMVGKAYEVLKDPEKRAAYDRYGDQWEAAMQAGGSPPPGAGPDGPRRRQESSRGADGAGGFEGFGGFRGAPFGQSPFGDDSFDQARGGSRFDSGSFSARGQDTHARVAISIEDAYRGATRALSLNQVFIDAQGRPSMREQTLDVRIPKGLRQGQQIRLAGQGGPGMGGGEAGDLYLEIEFEAHRLYHVEGRDVYLDVPIAPWEAALGAQIKVPTPEAGEVEVTVPAGSSGGRKLRLKGLGIPGKAAGDLYVVLKIIVPPADTDAARQAWQALQKVQSFNARAHFGS